jgi:glycosyltransferase involved in cell wall biosynthesis
MRRSREAVRAVNLVSFILPAWNEEAILGHTLLALKRAARILPMPHETIVVDDASTDGTARIAREHGAVVLPVQLRHMAATRNAGAKAARGDMLVFVDADTLVNEAVLTAAVQAVRNGAAGGSCLVLFDGVLPFYARLLVSPSHVVRRVFRLAAGCFVFCERGAFESVGGFSEKLYAAEEVALGASLKRVGRFVILPEPVVTSGRKLRNYSGWEILGIMARLAARGWPGLRSRKGLEIWYERRGDSR